MTRKAYTGARIFDGAAWWDNHALVVADGKIEGIIAADSPTDAIRVPADGAMIVPGFLDLQVNGAGGALLNETPTLDAIRTICATLTQFGCTGCLPTLITDTVPRNEAVIAAGATRFSLMPCAVPAVARLRVSPITPALAAAYERLLGRPNIPLDVVITTRP